MNELTKEEKIRAYNFVLSAIKSKKENFEGICIYLKLWLKHSRRNLFSDFFYLTGNSSGDMVEVFFEELLKYKPIDKILYSYWFTLNEEGNSKRIEILNNLIKELKQ